MRDASRYAVNVFPSVAIVNHVHENDRFYAQAELVLAQEVSQAHIELKSVGPCVQATVLMNAKAGKNAFDIRGNGTLNLPSGEYRPVDSVYLRFAPPSLHPTSFLGSSAHHS
jgi:hypothetical protein